MKMNFSFVLIVIFCVSTIGAATMDEQIKEYIKEVVRDFETNTKGWKIDSPLEYNVLQQIEKLFQDGYTPDWNSELSNRENVANLIIHLGKDSELQSIGITLDSILSEIIGVLPRFTPVIGYMLTDEQVSEAIAQTVIEVLTKLNVQGLDVSKSLRVNIETIVANSIDKESEKTNLGVLNTSPEEVIVNGAINALKLIQFQGFSPRSTLHDNVNTFLDNNF